MLHTTQVEKRKCTHELDAIKAAMGSSASLRRTMVAARDAGALGMDADFLSMLSKRAHSIMIPGSMG